MATVGRKIFGYAILAMGLMGVMAPGYPLRAQETAKPDNSATVQNPAKPQHPSPRTEGEEKLEEGGEADAIRNSPAVKFIARHTGLTKNQAYWLCIILNFAVIFFAMAGLLRKLLPGYFRDRTATIQKGIEEARKTSEDARRRLSEVEGRLSRLDADIAAMKREADENARAEEQRLLAAAEEERNRIVASAEQEIDMATNTARRELKSYAAELAIELAEKKIRVDKETDQALVRAFTSQMGKDGN